MTVSPDRILALLDRLAAAESQREALDVERLARALPDEIWEYDGWTGNQRQLAEEIAAAYLLSEPSREPGEGG